MTSAEIGTALKDARVRAGLRQAAVASALGISIWTLSRVENGTRSFDPSWMDLLPEQIRPQVIEVLKNIYRQEYWRMCNLASPDSAAA